MTPPAAPPPQSPARARAGHPILSVAIEDDAGVAAARGRARRIAELLGFDARDQARVAAATSEIARNVLSHGGGGGGRVEFLVAAAAEAGASALLIRVSDTGPGFADPDAVLSGRTPGLGIPGARRLVDGFRLGPGPAGRGTVVELTKRLPPAAAAPDAAALRAVAARLAADAPPDPAAVLADQNRDLVQSLGELRRRGEELERLNAELEDTNRGVVALHAELEERAEALRRAVEAKSRFLSSVSHEFRTPLNSILALSRLLLDHTDGPLSPEQERQVSLIRRSAEGLTEMVDDLLDLAKAEAGRLEARPAAFTVAELFGGLRGVLRPLLPGAAGPVALVFEEAAAVPPLLTDEAKVAQVLRNLASNALKFTEAGEVRVSAAYDPGGDLVRFAVRDTGIGIAPEDHERVFEEFAQVAGPLQRRFKGTGLGLPLSRRLAGLLGGTLRLESAPGRGSTFTLEVPRALPQKAATPPAAGDRRRVLVVDDDDGFRYVLRQMIDPERFEVEEASHGEAALALIRSGRAPDALVLDLRMPGLDGEGVMAALAGARLPRRIPVIVATSSALDGGTRARLATAGADAVVPKGELSRQGFSELLDRVTRPAGPRGAAGGQA